MLSIVIAGSVLASAAGLLACGGNDKPPLTPDVVEAPPPDPTTVEAGAPVVPVTPLPPK